MSSGSAEIATAFAPVIMNQRATGVKACVAVAAARASRRNVPLRFVVRLPVVWRSPDAWLGLFIALGPDPLRVGRQHPLVSATTVCRATGRECYAERTRG